MKKNDLTLGYVLLAICVFFFVMTVQLPKDARIYPMFIIILLATLTLLHLFLTYRKDSKEESKNFDGLILSQLIFVTIVSGIYIAVMGLVGYITSTILYVGTILIGLKINRVTAIIVSVVFVILVYGLFKNILHVPLPKGALI